ncbi:nuclear transport factor 2 family protein [Nocardioides hwasunensis]|uniref:nuclear transport factor 2 family protein n=1 Tax=Nocardioides hwasunensis TaxID=397258 RepID=UPI00296496C6|nr:nuclear transport factor 2 family protein [Nocardioides hwasunensis]
MPDATTESRLARLESRLEIQELAVLYGFYVDERDLDGLRELFCEDGSMSSEDGTYAARGVESVIATYERRFESLGASNHFTHGHVVRLDPDDPDRAVGLVAAHAEVHSFGTPMQVALRYKDVYRRTGGRWRFLDRCLSFMYYLPMADLATTFGRRDTVRMTDDRSPADWPEALFSSQGNSFLRTYDRHDR